ncbi:alpha-1,4-glucan--maltose-1-phosphate maltosyltransferase [Aquabacterium sp.]|uniref:alpha-1,4-glucan--maltose-1-phosphate maltosyltransferase n=1 Tax=Aquabacterium sp. TaxID=1872578 RepID=UPI0019BDB7AB|nr:alpha-1,4-glucan--maltose-1-phosphate maltosyltransferase [Aquabacterium sp.]MBC7701558.1 alpha-1,4-glucan--maltose-1-phosphate maltosyltransferase [Aquabacterium sp.]
MATPSSKRPAPTDLIPNEEDRQRAVIDAVLPAVDAGRFAVKAIAGEPMRIQANCFTDGHDVLRVMLLWRPEAQATMQEVEMALDSNDEWFASFTPEAPGRYFYSVAAWVDHFESWRHELTRRVDEEDIRIAALVGADLIDDAAKRAKATDQTELMAWARQLRQSGGEAQALKALALDEARAAVARRHPDRQLATQFPIELPLVADRERARFSTWYELFPRSTSSEPGQHGSFKDVEQRLPYVAEMGFDVLYFPPIHPIGREKRKGRNNALTTEPGDVGSPWAIGALEGGHKDVLPELGTMEDFRSLVSKAKDLGLEIALDIAFQCAPDHPEVKAHPEWFRWRPDGTVQYAENPPKKYQDIYPFNFETYDWRALWQELKSVFDHWIAQGVTIFRVDNPHTKAFPFWEWAITAIKREHPEVLFLAEAFTRPKVMHRLAKLGYSQSYTYFTWRHTKQELTEYFTELSQGPGKDYFRPNVWPNTPDILSEHLHAGGRPIFALRLVLAATLSSSYGLYGPAYELLDNVPRSNGSEEYLNSEKYQLRHWGDWDVARPDSLAQFIAKVNAIRRANPALQSNDSLRFFSTDNDQLIAYSKQTDKQTADGDNLILSIVNLDPHNPQSGWVTLDAEALKLSPTSHYEVHDLLSDQRFTWQGLRNFVILDPRQTPAHVFRLRKRVQDERHFDNFA